MTQLGKLLTILHFACSVLALVLLLLFYRHRDDWYARSAWIATEEEIPNSQEGKLRYQLTDERLDFLRSAKLPEYVLAKLLPLKGRGFETRQEFLDEVTNALSRRDDGQAPLSQLTEPEVKQFAETIARYAALRKVKYFDNDKHLLYTETIDGNDRLVRRELPVSLVRDP